jgi:hypothetical protein
MFGSRPGLALAVALSLTLATACAATPLDDAPSSGEMSTGGASNTRANTGGTSSDDARAGAPTAPGDGEAGDANTATTPPYANVTAVAASGTSGSYTFNVTVESADIDCSQYADWWEVLTDDGSLVYRRILEHSHTDANGTSDADAPGNTFTRSGGPVPISESDVVVVRAHMSVGGYNGSVMRGSVTDGFVQAPDVGADFAAAVEREDPQPDGCEF